MKFSYEIKPISQSQYASACTQIEDSAMKAFADVYPESNSWSSMEPSEYSEYIANDNAIGAWIGDELVGFLIFDLITDNQIYLSEMNVDIDHQGKGIGESLIRYFIAQWTKKNADAIYLRTFENTPWSINLYKKVGFVVLDNETDFLRDEAQQESDAGLPMNSRINMMLWIKK